MTKKLIIYSIILLLTFFQHSCKEELESPYPPFSWEQKAGFPDGVRASSTVAVVGNKAYIFFGKKAINSQYKNDCWEYDATNNSWCEKTACPGQERVKAISVEYNGKIYTGLGYNGKGLYSNENYLKDFWEYNPETDEWKEKAPAPFLGTDACVAFVYKDEIYVGMGFHGIVFGYEFWKYNLLNNVWIKLNNFPGQARSGGILCANDYHIFFGTGYLTSNASDWWEYFPESDKWRKRKSIPDKGRVNGTALCVQNRFFISTGRYFKGNLTGGHLKSDIMEYDPTRNGWYDCGNIPGAARENAITFTIDGKGFIGLGESDNTLFNDLLCFKL